MKAIELIAFLEQARHEGAPELRLAPARSLILICPSETAIAAVLKAARAAGLVVDAADPRARIFACPGSAGCASGHIDAREIAASVARQMSALSDPDFALHISGCPKGCAHPAPAALTLVGTEDGPVLVENGIARQPGMPVENQYVVARLVAELQSRANGRSQSETRRKPHPTHALAGD
jgi:precorrin-3B synthase